MECGPMTSKVGLKGSSFRSNPYWPSETIGTANGSMADCPPTFLDNNNLSHKPYVIQRLDFWAPVRVSGVPPVNLDSGSGSICLGHISIPPGNTIAQENQG